MAQNKRRKPRTAGGFVPKSQRDFGTLEQHQERRVVGSTSGQDPISRATRRAGIPSPDARGPIHMTPGAAYERAAERGNAAGAAVRRAGITPKRVAIGAGVAGAAVGTGYLVQRHQQKKVSTMSKSLDLVNPFEEVVAFGKAYPRNVTSGSHVRRLSALVPTGRHVGHGNALTHVSHGSGGGRNATRLERYTTKTVGHRQGPFGKAAGGGSVRNGLDMIAAMPKPTKVASQKFSAPTPRIGRNSNIPDGARKGSKL